MNFTPETSIHKTSNDRRKSIRYFLVIFFPLLILLSGVLSFFYWTEQKTLLAEVISHEIQQVDSENKLIEHELLAISADLAFLSEHNELRAALNGSASRLDQLAEEYLTFARTKKVYDQIRLLNQSGMETVRVNYNGGQPQIVAADQLQDKKDRYYFKETIKLNRGQNYVSPFDLNVEQGEVEKPFKPVIRFGAPVFDEGDNKKGIIILNYLGTTLLQHLGEVADDSFGNTMLLNKDGYWIYSPTPEDEWGFMFETGMDRTMAHAIPDAWQIIKDKKSGQIQTDKGLFTFTRAYPFKNTAPEYFWLIVSHVSEQKLSALLAPIQKRIGLLFVVLFWPLMACSGFVSWLITRRQRAETATRLALGELNHIFETVEDGIIVTDHELIIRRVNRKLLDMLELTESEIVNHNYQDLFAEQYQSPGESPCTKILHGEKIAQLELKRQQKNGDFLFCEHIATPLMRDDDKIIGIVICVRDLTGRNQTEQLLRKKAQVDAAMAELSSELLSENTLEEIADSVITKAQKLTGSPHAFAGIIDNQTGHLVCPTMTREIWDQCRVADKNNVFKKFYGLWGWAIENKQPVLTNNPAQDIRSTGVPAGHIPIKRFMAVPAMINREIVGQLALANSEQDYTAQDLEAVKQMANLFAIAIQRKRGEEALHRLLMGTAAVTGERFFSTMVEQLAKCLGTKHVLVGEFRPNDHTEIKGLAFWNKNGLDTPIDYNIKGAPCEMANQHGFCHYPNKVAQLFPQDKALTDWGIEFYAGMCLYDEQGTPLGILCALHDQRLEEIPHLQEIFKIFSNRTAAEILRQRAVTALTQAKASAEQANLAKSRFLANMSHELRTPLNSIIGFASVLQEQYFGPLNEKQLEYSNDIKESGHHLLSLINDILDLSKIEAGKMDFEPTPVNIPDLLKRSMNMIKEKVMKKGIDLRLDIADNMRDLLLNIDERKIKQVLFNLLSNATKFTPDGGIITLGMKQQEDAVVISVIDTGIGIDPENIGNIFNPFFQVSGEYRDKTPGTGLGLTLTKTLIEMHEGTIRATSKGKGAGACFAFSLPLSCRTNSREPQQPPVTSAKILPLKNTSHPVLIIEDDRKMAKLLHTFLTEAGFQAENITDGAAAVEKTKKGKPPFITLDILLPKQNGWEILTELKADPATKNIPVIVISAGDSRQKAMAAGAHDFLTKPVSRNDFLKAVNKLAMDQTISQGQTG
ncbi:MAG: GAF domain-containing protein [Desulfobulbaceae bacterium]|nr:GAF domain-containing protein [Desulfobulbaceae bacterium]